MAANPCDVIKLCGAGAMDRDQVKPCPVFMWGYQSSNLQKELDCVIDVGFIMVIFNAICL